MCDEVFQFYPKKKLNLFTIHISTNSNPPRVSSFATFTYRIMTYIQIPSVCLPRVWHKFDKNYIEGIFCELFGPAADGDSCVDRIDMIPKKDRNTGEDFWVVFIHFSELMISSDFLEDFVDRINSNEEIKIQYNPPWFWKVRKNTGTRKEATRTGPRIMSRKDEEQLMATQKQILQQI